MKGPNLVFRIPPWLPLAQTISAGVLLLLAPISAFSQAERTSSSGPHVDTSGVNQQPLYPATALAGQERGAVVLGVAVTAEGTVRRVALVKTSRFNDLDGAAISAVLGWHFIPAKKDGSAVDSTALVKLIFEPPPKAGSNPAPTEPAPTSDVLFPSQFEMKADDGRMVSASVPIPCSRGIFQADVKILGDATNRGNAATLELALSAMANKVLFVVHHYEGGPLIGAFVERITGSQYVSGSNFWGSGEIGLPVALSLSWDPHGEILANGGRTFGAHNSELQGPPQTLAIDVYSGVVEITDASLICLPPLP